MPSEQGSKSLDLMVKYVKFNKRMGATESMKLRVEIGMLQLIELKNHTLDPAVAVSGPDRLFLSPIWQDVTQVTSIEIFGQSHTDTNDPRAHRIELKLLETLGKYHIDEKVCPQLAPFGDHVTGRIDLLRLISALDENTEANQQGLLFSKPDPQTLYCLKYIEIPECSKALALIFVAIGDDIPYLYFLFGFSDLYTAINSLDKTKWFETAEEAAETLEKHLETKSLERHQQDPTSDDDYWGQYDDGDEIEKQEQERSKAMEDAMKKEFDATSDSAETHFRQISGKAISSLFEMAASVGISAEKCENLLLEKIVHTTREKSKEWGSSLS